MPAVFNSNAFDSNAFECGVAAVGWFPEWDLPSKARPTREQFNSILAQQRALGSDWYNSLFMDEQMREYLREFEEEQKKNRADWYEHHIAAMQLKRKMRARRN